MRGLVIASGAVLMVLLQVPENPVIAQAPFIEPALFTGSWVGRNHENDRNPLTGDYSGIPLNAEARARADAWSNTSQEMPERLPSRARLHEPDRQPDQDGLERDPLFRVVVDDQDARRHRQSHTRSSASRWSVSIGLAM